MFYIFSQNFLKGKNKNDRDFLLLIDTLESNNINYKFLKNDFNKITNKDYIFLDIGSDDLSKYLDQLNQIDTKNIYPNINVIPTLYLKDKFCKFCEDKGLKIPKTFYNIDHTINTDYPLVFKPVSGSLSEHLKICNNKEEVLKQISILQQDDSYFNKDYILQEFIDTGENPCKYRIIYIGNDVKLTYKAVSLESEYFCSLLEDGKIHSINITNENVLNLAQEFFKNLQPHIDFAALDILESTQGECFLLECNAPTKLYRSSQAIKENLYQNIIDFMLTKE
jgi:glutathione synthase/RimK-type ligase-like ATP-grasp enzyme